MSKKYDYIQKLGQHSTTEYHELIDECLKYYNVSGTKELTEKQLEDFCKLKEII